MTFHTYHTCKVCHLCESFHDISEQLDVHMTFHMYHICAGYLSVFIRSNSAYANMGYLSITDQIAYSQSLAIRPYLFGQITYSQT